MDGSAETFRILSTELCFLHLCDARDMMAHSSIAEQDRHGFVSILRVEGHVHDTVLSVPTAFIHALYDLLIHPRYPPVVMHRSMLFPVWLLINCIGVFPAFFIFYTLRSEHKE